MATFRHLASRFFGSLLPLGPNGADAAWALEHLGAGERAVWARMSPADRRHAAGVARRTTEALGERATRDVVAAALLHDSGKVESGLGTLSRVVATVAAMIVGRTRVESWPEGKGFPSRIGLYSRHPELGAALLSAAGSAPLTTTWTREHHLPEARWTLAPDLGRVLKAADDD